jgi:DNA-binding NarL/FixJ family response regulator
LVTPTTKLTLWGSSVLIVDDEATMRNLLAETLGNRGYRCVLAADAAEARRCLLREDFELILCDIRMPGESGLDLIRHLRGVYPDTGVIMVTALENPHEAQTALDMGIFGYLIKPFESNQLLISVANALRLRELEMGERSYRQNLEQAVRERTEALSQSNEALRRRESDLVTRTRELEEANIALKVLLEKREQDKKTLGEDLAANVHSAVEPFLQKLKGSRLDEEQQRNLNLLEQSLGEIVTPFIKDLSSAFLGLTPSEIQVAILIKQGKSSKDIAGILNLSINTVMSHRYKVRKKMGLLQSKTNLRSFLHSLINQ